MIDNNINEKISRIASTVGYTGNVKGDVCFIGIEPGGPAIKFDELKDKDWAEILYLNPGDRYSEERFLLEDKDWESIKSEDSDLKQKIPAIDKDDKPIELYRANNPLIAEAKKILFERGSKKGLWAIASKILGEAYKEESINDGPKKETLHGVASVQINLFPLSRPGTGHKLHIEIDDYSYLEICMTESGRIKNTIEFLSNNKFKAIICCGLGHFNDFLRLFKERKKFSFQNGSKFKYCSFSWDKLNIPIFIVPFLNNWTGYNFDSPSNNQKKFTNELQEILTPQHPNSPIS
jgi:hypothetical protein